MIVENPLPAQLTATLWSVWLGVLLGAIYGAFRLVRNIARSRVLECILDLLFSMLGCAIVFVLVTAVVQMRLRGFLLVGLLAGWLIWEQTAGRLLRWLCEHVHAAIKRHRREKIPRKTKK